MQHGTLYRSQGGARLPECFYSTSDTEPAGGVERGFLSATTSRLVAAQHPDAGPGASTVLCLKPGAFVRGALVEHLSQYPEEEEVRGRGWRCLRGVCAPQCRMVSGIVCAGECMFAVQCCSVVLSATPLLD